ncbi:hypothetical protein B296_00009284 [Ensete ventricosum]|uniref:Uncharacterized protein n=1 Tax=Ensete ventricosum TaxID=4639 RepID=A0A426ZPL9_ENSVE|nr:hypothetical protein B296_00009284 [Ensete ventricosum]
MLLKDGSQGNLDQEAVAMVEEEEGSSNADSGCSATAWLQVEVVVVCRRLWQRWLQQRCGCDRGKKRKGGHGCCKGGQQQWAAGVGNLRSEGSLLAASKSDGSDISLLATLRDRFWPRARQMAAGDHCWQRLCSKRSLLAAAKVDGSERSLLVVIKSLLATIKVDGCERSLLAAFVQQEIAASCDQGRWQRVIAAGSVVQREIAVGHDQIAAGRNQGRWL